jgi:hypothetical protein
VRGEFIVGIVVMLRRVEQCFGRDATNIEASAPKHIVAFDDGRFKAQLGATNGGYVSSWSGADDGNVVFHDDLELICYCSFVLP